MTLPRFLVRTGLDGADEGGDVDLVGAEARHAAKARRLRTGELVEVGDGAGTVVRASVSEVSAEGVRLHVHGRRTEPQPLLRLTVVQALAKADRGESAVTAMTEVGVDRIIPWSAQRSVVRLTDERAQHRRQRWQSAAREAAKQARRAYVPEVEPVREMEAVLEVLSAATLALVLHEDAVLRLTHVGPPERGDVVLVVGPEGGITKVEMAAMEQVGAAAVRLGPTVLRSVTAGTAAASAMMVLTGRW